MPKRTDIHKIMVIGSGPIIIGQAAEFDYAGSQACAALREEGYEVILINSNPATIMTDTSIADKVYIEPLTLEFAKRVIYKERPDAILGSLGGQTGLNLVVELFEDGILEEYGVEVLGTDIEAINRAEDRELFDQILEECRLLLEELDVDPLHFTSNHASNYLPLKGGLPEDKEKFLHMLDEALAGKIRLRKTLNRGI